MLRGEKWTFKEHLPYQAFYVAFYTGYMPVLLYLPVYLKYLGLSSSQVGLLCGLRPLLQAIGAPILITLSTKFHAKRLLFVASCILMIGKFFVILILLRPTHSTCKITYSDGRVEFRHMEHRLTRRDVIMDGWSQVLNYTSSDLKFEDYDANKVLKLQSDPKDKINSWPTMQPEAEQPAFGQVLNTTHAQKNQTRMINYRVYYNQHELYLTFMIILILTLATAYFDACIFALVDNVYRPNVAWVWGDLVWGVMTFIIGIVVDQMSYEQCGKILGAFHYVFYFNAAFVTIALFLGFRLDFTVDPYEADLTSRILSSKWNFQYNIVILAYTLMGFCNGFLFTFVYWFIDELGGDALIMGLSTCVECLVSMVVFFVVYRLIDYIGHMSAICAGFVGYIGLFLSYAEIDDPWLVLAAKVLQAVISGMMMFACNSFLKSAAPAGSSYQMQGN